MVPELVSSFSGLWNVCDMRFLDSWRLPELFRLVLDAGSIGVGRGSGGGGVREGRVVYFLERKCLSP